MSGTLEGVAQNWLTDQPWQKVIIQLLIFISYMFLDGTIIMHIFDATIFVAGV